MVSAVDVRGGALWLEPVGSRHLLERRLSHGDVHLAGLSAQDIPVQVDYDLVRDFDHVHRAAINGQRLAVHEHHGERWGSGGHEPVLDRLVAVEPRIRRRGEENTLAGHALGREGLRNPDVLIEVVRGGVGKLAGFCRGCGEGESSEESEEHWQDSWVQSGESEG